MRFYLGTHMANWLADPRFRRVPLFVSARRLRPRRSLPRAVGPWALDSGGFSELSLFGGWRTPAAQYSSEVRHWGREVGGMRWAAAQDWMCEPFITAKTGLSVAEHQRATVANYLLLRQLGPSLPVVPVLQGWEHDDYLRHLDAYAAAGVDLTRLPLVGLGSICRRQATAFAEALVRDLHGRGLRLHGFGLKLGGLVGCAPYLVSADSMAWSFRARRRGRPLKGCAHGNCNSCPRFALLWRRKVLRAVRRGLGRPRQRTFW